MSILFFIIAISFILFIYWYMYKQLNTINKKLLYILLLVTYFSPVILYTIDRYDLSHFFISDVDLTRWFDFTTTYVTAIIAAVINGVILLLITFKQMDLQKDYNNENTRLQNAPILEYLVSTDNKAKSKDHDEFVILNKGNSFRIYVDFENIGLGHARNIDFEFVIDKVKLRGTNKKNNRQKVIKRDTNYLFSLDFSLICDESGDNIHELKIISYYEDLLFNKYTQEVVLSLHVTKDAKKKHKLTILDCEVLSPEIERCKSK